jgi:hypothetical protein
MANNSGHWSKAGCCALTNVIQYNVWGNCTCSTAKYEQEGLGVQVMQNNGVFCGMRRGTENSPTFIISDIDYADDCILLAAESENDLQLMS